MKCADLKDVVILRALADNTVLTPEKTLGLFHKHVVPLKVARAKLDKLARRKLVYAGGHGDFSITELGLIELARLEGRVLEHRPHLSKGAAPAWLDKMIDASIEKGVKK